jgi:alanine racemase
MRDAIPGGASRSAEERHQLGIDAPAYAPRLRVSSAALVENIRTAVASGATAIDARASAWGHGRDVVGRAALEAGARRVRIDVGVRPRRWGLDDDQVQYDDEGVADPLQVYGLPDATGTLRGRPAMSLSGRVLLTKALRAGEGISYGYTHRAAHDTRVALVTGGYAQGVVRAVGNHVSVAIGDALHPVVGRVAMDVSMIDIGDAEVSTGDEVVFFGDPDAGAPGLGAWVTATGLSAAEIVAGVARRAMWTGSGP